MKNRNIRSKDLNLIPIFHALMAERNVSRAAETLGLTQPAISHALKRLRFDFGDDLFVRSAKGMVPTPFALTLREKMTPLVATLEDVYQTVGKFDPKTAQARISVATTDMVEATVLPKLVALLRRDAPSVTAQARAASGQLPKHELETGLIDSAIAGYFGELPEGFFQQKLFSDGFSSAVRKGHPALKQGRLTLEAFAAAEHVLISPQGDLRARMDQELKKRHLTRRIVAATSSFLSPAWMVADSDLVVTAPSRVIAACARYFPLKVFETPVTLPPIQVIHVWHERTHRSPLHRWFREAVESVSRDA